MSTSSVEAALRELGLGACADRLAALALPCVRLLTTASDDSAIPVGATKVGGAPDLPEGATWPASNGAPLSFLGQIDLRTVAGMPGAEVLPDAGLLSFFYDAEQSTWGFSPSDRGSWRVFHTAPGVPLRRLPMPDALPEYGRYVACAVQAAPALSLPAWDEDAVSALGMDDHQANTYAEWQIDFQYGHAGGALNRLLGWADPIQNAGMGLECQLASSGIYVGGPEGYAEPRAAELTPGAAEWRLLLQLDSDYEAEMMWGDMGRLYFWIRESDLAARNWDDVWMVLQCS